MLNPNTLSKRDDVGIQILKCDVCGKDVEFNEDAQITADTILCRECILKTAREGSSQHSAVMGRFWAEEYNQSHSAYMREFRAKDDHKYAYSIRAPR